MRLVAERIRANVEELAELEAREVGKPCRDELRFDVSFSHAAFDYFAGLAETLHGEILDQGPIEAYRRVCCSRSDPGRRSRLHQIVARIITAVGFLGVSREIVPDFDFSRLAPAALGHSVRKTAAVPTSLAASITAPLLRVAVSLAVGAWRTTTRDA